jgi:hypothetical protein
MQFSRLEHFPAEGTLVPGKNRQSVPEGMRRNGQIEQFSGSYRSENVPARADYTDVLRRGKEGVRF